MCITYYLENGVRRVDEPLQLLPHTGSQMVGPAGAGPGLVGPEVHTILRCPLKNYEINAVSKAIQMALKIAATSY